MLDDIFKNEDQIAVYNCTIDCINFFINNKIYIFNNSNRVDLLDKDSLKTIFKDREKLILYINRTCDLENNKDIMNNYDYYLRTYDLNIMDVGKDIIKIDYLLLRRMNKITKIKYG
jgi:hypothetical protein